MISDPSQAVEKGRSRPHRLLPGQPAPQAFAVIWNCLVERNTAMFGFQVQLLLLFFLLNIFCLSFLCVFSFFATKKKGCLAPPVNTWWFIFTFNCAVVTIVTYIILTLSSLIFPSVRFLSIDLQSVCTLFCMCLIPLCVSVCVAE